eukprot:scaffold68898_cov56-Attheya_sp.AAC.1
MAANINRDLSTMAASSAVPSEEGTPIVNVSEIANSVTLKWGDDVTNELHRSIYTTLPTISTPRTQREGNLFSRHSGPSSVAASIYHSSTPSRRTDYWGTAATNKW